MTRTVTTILLCTLGFISFGQTISVDTLFLPVAVQNPPQHHARLKFPIIKTGNPQVDSILNADLKNRFTNHAFPELATDSTLIQWGEQIIYLDFTVTYLQNGLLSLHINAEGCGAYCTPWTAYYTYNYQTGQYVTLDRIMDTTGPFTQRVIAHKNKQYAQQKKALAKMKGNKSEPLDADTYNWALEHYENCAKAFTLENFALYPGYLEIMENCYLPNAIKSLTPTIILKYRYANIKRYLKINL